MSDWNDRIKAAVKRGGRFTEDDMKRAVKWTTCACGKQERALFPVKADEDSGAIFHVHSSIPDREPWDLDLVDLGCKFNTFVSSNYVREARDTLKSINARAAFLLRELKKRPRLDVIKDARSGRI